MLNGIILYYLNAQHICRIFDNSMMIDAERQNIRMKQFFIDTTTHFFHQIYATNIFISGDRTQVRYSIAEKDEEYVEARD